MELLEFWTICSANGIILTKGQSEQFERYHNELIYWNEKVNLVSRKDEKNIFERHILHSLSLLKYADIKKNARCLDVGTGGGLPGIPLKIARPDLKMLLVDSISKKIKITKMLAQHTGLKDISAISSRAEDLENNKEYVGHFDVVVSRAVARTASIMGWVRNLVKPVSKIVLLKGGSLDDEIDEAMTEFPGMKVRIYNIDMFGAGWLKEDDKKIVECSFK